MRRFSGALLILILLLFPAPGLQPARAQNDALVTANAFVGAREQAGPSAEAIDGERGLIYKVFSRGGVVVVVGTEQMRITRQWVLPPALTRASGRPLAALNARGDRLAILVTSTDRADIALFNERGGLLAQARFPYDGRPIALIMSMAGAFVLRADAPLLRFDGTLREVDTAPGMASPVATVSGDGRTLAYLAVEGSERVRLSFLDVETLALRPSSFTGPATASYTLATTRDGSRLYVASCGGVAEVQWSDGSVLRSLDNEQIGCLTDLELSPDGTLLVAMTFSPSGSTSVVVVDVPTWQVARRVSVDGGFGTLTPLWRSNKVFVSTQDYRTLQPVFAGVLDIREGAPSRIAYGITGSDGRYGFADDDLSIRRFDADTGRWRALGFGGRVTRTVRSAQGTIFAQVGGLVARIPAGATAPDAFFLGGADLALAGDRLLSHDRQQIFVSDLADGTSQTLAFLPPAGQYNAPLFFDPLVNKLVLFWVNVPRNALPQTGLAIVDLASGTVKTPSLPSSRTIAAALDPGAHRLYVAVDQVSPEGTSRFSGELTIYDLATDTAQDRRLSVAGLAAAQLPALAFDAARGLLALSDGTNLVAVDRGGRQVWRTVVPGAALAIGSQQWIVGGNGSLALVDPANGRIVARTPVVYAVSAAGQSGGVIFGFDRRSGALISAVPAGGELLLRIEGFNAPPTSFEPAADVVVLGDEYGRVTVLRPDRGTANRGNRSAFSQVWERADAPVAGGSARRSWTWGPQAWAVQAEPYAESPGGQRLVEYRDKTRMEVTRPGADRNAPWYVTNGLLVTEMLRGQIQVGDQSFEPAPCPADPDRTGCPNAVPIAGDALNNTVAPTYADAAPLLVRAERATGERVGTTYRRTEATGGFAVGRQAELATAETTLVEYDSVTGHNIPRVFWSYMTQRGLVLENGRLVERQVVDPLFAFGRPLTEPYWITARVGGVERTVLLQLFERRSLTYTPQNPEPFQVEMGNVGQHYYRWRYGVARYE